ncbi:MAG TPA: cupin domain-containing protein [Acidobacteriota bacterium]|nr:cupin domain-containing protein [Acidobacteriota bacterium]HQM63479.1 cupin domain-containing protein [Acidobacteriota bacterium]
MTDVFPELIRCLPRADIPLPGVRAYLSQGEDHQVLFMEFTADAAVPEHAHAAQWGVVVAGRIDLVIDGVPHTFGPGDSYAIPAGVPHSARIHAGYADVTCFAQRDRYRARPPELSD